MVPALLLAALVAALPQTPTPDQVSTALAASLVTVLGIVGSVLEQLVKKALTPFENASPVVKGAVTFAWGLGLAWLGPHVPAIAAALPADPGALGTALNGILLTLVMMGVHSAKKIAQDPSGG